MLFYHYCAHQFSYNTELIFFGTQERSGSTCSPLVCQLKTAYPLNFRAVRQQVTLTQL